MGLPQLGVVGVGLHPPPSRSAPTGMNSSTGRGSSKLCMAVHLSERTDTHLDPGTPSGMGSTRERTVELSVNTG